ncbi:hypothetical protein K2173_015131 [Erythroxylum novogranatense]|uniref:Fe2OG dioxygenase domain-containing protein n=1 Tax=Erythroxylum novogranatense TaxID=1862640 RepID=A0AAV8T2D0_9ROSI|nr:hypothetical protein K2173_015131 [Erythroxylum novogranatense]
MAPSPLQPHSTNDRLAKLQSFDQSKVGVKGLVDAGIEKIPDIFVLPPDPEVADDQGSSATHPISLQIPVIDLKYVHDEENKNARKQIVQEILEASEKWGFFQVVNHGVSTDTLEKMIDGVREFHEQPNEEKMKFYSRDISRKVRYNSNFNLYDLKAANWRDTSYFIMAPDAPQPEEFPEVCRDITIKYSAQAREVGITIFELLSEALGLKSNHLTDIGCAEGHYILCHYYPACPQPKLAIGTTPHKDATFITILLQDQIGGLQVLYDHKWVDVPPVPGALIVNIGDFLQFSIVNFKIKSPHA